jgi:hypothetical protein
MEMGWSAEEFETIRSEGVIISTIYLDLTPC